MTLYKGNKVIAGSRSYIGNIGDIKYTARVDLPFGGSWCDGSIKLKAQFPTVYQMLIDGKLQALDIATYESALNLNGSCGFFGLDTATESFRVPSLNDVYIKSGQEAETFGAESLPNIKGTGGYDTNTNEVGSYWSGAFAYTNTSNQGVNGDGGASALFTFNASRSSSTYQDGAKVNPDHVKYRAYVVLYTGADTNIDITKEIQLNNPFSFGMSQWFESDPKNASWLLSDGAFHSGAIYESFYNWLVSEYNNPDMLPRKLNATVIGNPTISDGVVSGFSTSNYLVLDNKCKSTDNAEYVFKFTTDSDVTTPQRVFHSQLLFALETSGGVLTDYSFGGDYNTTILNLLPNTTYWIKVIINGTTRSILYSEDGINYTGETVVSDTGMDPNNTSYQFRLGVSSYNGQNPFLGSIDLTQSYIKINNQIWWRGFANNVKKDFEIYGDYDYVINTTEETFRLPLNVLNASGNAVVGNGVTLGVINGIEKFGLAEYNGGTYANYTAYGTDVGTALSHVGGTTIERSFGVTTDPAKSGIETSSNGLKLYFYVGETVQDANLINASKVLDLLAKLESYDYIVEYKAATAEDPTWYRVYKSGWVEQGGILVSTGDSAQIVNLPVIMKDSNYQVFVTRNTSGDFTTNINGRWCEVYNVTSSSFTTWGTYFGMPRIFWRACGQGA